MTMQLLASAPLVKNNPKALLLKVEALSDSYAFYFGEDGADWQLLKAGVDARWLSTHTAGGFVGCTIWLYASAHGKESSSVAVFHWFEYTGKDVIYQE